MDLEDDAEKEELLQLEEENKEYRPEKMDLDSGDVRHVQMLKPKTAEKKAKQKARLKEKVKKAAMFNDKVSCLFC